MSKKELIDHVPNDIVLRNKMQKNIVEYRDALLEIESQKDLIKSILEGVEESIGIKKAIFKQHGDLSFDIKYNEKKKTKKIEDDAELLAEHLTHFTGE